MNDFGCETCWPPDASKAWDAIRKVPVEARLIDQSHYIVSIRACPSCSQRYLQVTTETVDWTDGEDPIYRTIVPIEPAEQARLTASNPLAVDVIESVGMGRRSLRYDWPKGKQERIYWGTGMRVGAHD